MQTPDIRPAAGSHLEQAVVAATTRPHMTLGTDRVLTVAASPREMPRSNVLADVAHHDALGDALAAVAKIVGRTLGPHGSNTLIRDEGGAHFATKDGYTVLQRLTFVQETATMVLDHVRSVSRAMVRKVGDGSTSAVIMADSLYHSLTNVELLKKHPPGAVQAALNAVAEVLTDRIRAAAKPLDLADIETVATVAANNDPWAGSIVADAYRIGGSDANVFVAIGGEKTDIRKEPGYRVMRGMSHECFANEVGIDGSARTTCRLRDAAVMVFDGVVDQAAFNQRIAKLMNECLERGQPFVLVAREYTMDVLQVVVEFKRRSPGAMILLLDHASATRRGAARMGDLAAALGCQVFNAESPEGTLALGSAVEVRSTASETVFVMDSVTHAAAVRADELRAQIERVDAGNHAEAMSEELDELRARIRALLGSEVTIFVGGATEQEKRTLQYLLDDAALAVAAAKRSGVVEGLGLTVQRVLANDNDAVHDAVRAKLAERVRLSELDVAELADAVLDAVGLAYMSSTCRVLTNSRLEAADILHRCLRENKTFNAVTREYTPVDKAQVINPADTDIEVLRGAMSIVGLFISSDQTLLTRPTAGGGLD